MSDSRASKTAAGPTAAPPHSRTAIASTFERPQGHSTVEAGIGSDGHQIEPAARDELEARFGQDFSHVRVHADGRAADAADSLRANAYTVGRDVVFGRGRYTPGTSDGRQLLAHELAHVVQQGRGRGQASGYVGAESEARQAGARAVSGQPVAIQSAGAGGVQLDSKDDDDPALRAFSRTQAQKENPAIGSPEWVRRFQGKPEAQQSATTASPAGSGPSPPTGTAPTDSRAHTSPPKPANLIDAFRAPPITREDAQRLYDNAPIAVPEAVTARVQGMATDARFREHDRVKRQLSEQKEGTPGRAELRTQERAMDREAQERRTAYEQSLKAKLPEMAKAMDDELAKEDRGLRTFKPHDFVQSLTSEAYGEHEYRIFGHGVRRYVRGALFPTVEEHHWLIGLGTLNFVTGEVKPESHVEFRGGAESEGLGPLDYIMDIAGAVGVLRGLAKLAVRPILRSAGRLATTSGERALGRRIAKELGPVPGGPAEAPRGVTGSGAAPRGAAGPLEGTVRPPATTAAKGTPASTAQVPKAEPPGGASTAPRPAEAPKIDAAPVGTPPRTSALPNATEASPPSPAAPKTPVAKTTEAAPPAPAAPKGPTAAKPADAAPAGSEPSTRPPSVKDPVSTRVDPVPDNAPGVDAPVKQGAAASAKAPPSSVPTAKPAEAGAGKAPKAQKAPSPASQTSAEALKAQRVAGLQQKRADIDNRVKELETRRDLHEERRTKYQDEATKRQNAGKRKDDAGVANKQRQASNEANLRAQKDSEIAMLKTEKARLKGEIDDINRPRAETPQQEGRDAEARITRDSGMPKHEGKHETSFPGSGSPTGLRTPDFMPKPDGKGGWINAKDPGEAEWIADSKVVPEAGKIRLTAQVKGFIELASKIKLTPSRTRKVLMLITDQEIAPEVIKFGEKYGVQVFRASQPPW